VSQSPKAGVFDGIILKSKSRSVNNIVNFFALYIELCLCVCQHLQVMKVKELAGGVMCFVAKLNRSSSALPQALLDDDGTVSTQVNTI